jgi:hypothetical protein
MSRPKKECKAGMEERPCHWHRVSPSPIKPVYLKDLDLSKKPKPTIDAESRGSWMTAHYHLNVYDYIDAFCGWDPFVEMINTQATKGTTHI